MTCPMPPVRYWGALVNGFNWEWDMAGYSKLAQESFNQIMRWNGHEDLKWIAGALLVGRNRGKRLKNLIHRRLEGWDIGSVAYVLEKYAVMVNGVPVKTEIFDVRFDDPRDVYELQEEYRYEFQASKPEWAGMQTS